MDGIKNSDAMPIIEANLDPASHVLTDESYIYCDLAMGIASHKSVDHSREEYAYTPQDRRARS
jgi:hypothetical protein